jgi:periplasmic divalent cation tolerance protein
VSEHPPAVRVVLCTCPKDHAERIARTILEERLVACVNVVAGVRSLYWWKDAVQDDEETLLVIKTPVENYAALEERLLAIHPYTVPEVLGLDVVDGSRSYISWVRELALC